MAQDSQINTFTGGLDLDTDKRIVKNDKMTFANNAELMPTTSNTLASAEPMKSTKYQFTVPDVAKQYQVDRLIYHGVGTYTFTFSFAITNPLSFNFAGANFADFVSDFDAAFTTWAAGTYDYQIPTLVANSGDPYVLVVYFASGNILEYTLTNTFDGVDSSVITVQDAVNDTQMLPIAYATVQDYEFVFSIGVDSTCQSIGIAKETNGTFSYTSLFVSNKLGWSSSNVFDIRVEVQANNYFGIYWTDFANKPKVLYIPIAYTEDCALKYDVLGYLANNGGLYTLNALEKQSNLQLINNTVRCQYSDQIQSGGSLVSGGYRYAIRCGIAGSDNVTEWCTLSNLIPVFKTSTNAPNAGIRIQGDVAGEATSKVNVIQVNGAQSDVFDFVELAAVHYAGGAQTAYLVKRQYITTDDFTLTHVGNEQTTALDIASLPPTEEVIVKAESLEIKKNRLNLANCDVAISDDTFVELASSFQIDSGYEELDTVGELGNLLSNDVYANSNADQTVSNIVIDFNYIVYDQYGQFNGSEFTATSGQSTFFCKVFVSGVYYSEFTFVLYENGIPVQYSPTIILENSQSFTYDLGQLMYGNTFAKITTSIGAKYSFGAVLGGGGSPTIKASSETSGTYVRWANAWVDNYSAFQDVTVGEYQLPENVANKLGYTVNENYALYAKFHLKNGYITKPYYIGEEPVFANSDQSPFTTSSHTKTYAYKYIVSNFNLQSLRDADVVGVSIWRAICNPTILGTGVSLLANTVIDSNYTVGYYAGIPVSPNQYYSAVPNSNVYRQFGIFYSPDTRIAKTQYSTGDSLKVYGTPNVYQSSISNGQIISAGGDQYKVCMGSYAEYAGSVNTTSATDYSLDDGAYVNFDSVSGVRFGSENYQAATTWGIGNGGASGAEGVAFHTTTKITSNGVQDNGVYLSQWIRQVTDQYNQDSITVVPTGAYLEIAQNDNSFASLDVWGGDTYTQKSFLKVMYGSANATDYSQMRYSFISYYGQNKVNTQLFYTNKTLDSNSWNIWAQDTVYSYLFPTVVSDSNPEEQFNYDKGYDAPNTINTDTPYNSLPKANSHFGSRIWYSNEKPTGSVYDFYRRINPLDFKDLDAKNGDIVSLYDVNDVMVAVQLNAVSVLPYQSDVAISNTTGADIYVGQGSVYAQRENIISGYGTNIKTAVFRGQNSNGNYTLYWYSPFKKLLRYGTRDGVKILSDGNGLRSFFLNNTNFITQNWDIIMGYDVNRDTVFITSRGYNKGVAEWNSGTTYGVGNAVKYYAVDKCNTFEYEPNFYTSRISPNTGNNPYDQDTAWSWKNTSDTTYYNYWTVAFNEKINSFSTFADFRPARYFNYLGRILCPNPRGNDVHWGQIDELFANDQADNVRYLKFFGVGANNDDPKQASFQIEVTTNKNGLVAKRMIASVLSVGTSHDTANNPTLNVYNDSQNCSMSPTDWELRMGNLATSIKDDDQDRPLIGEWFSYKITSTKYLRFMSFINSFYTKFRTAMR